MPVDPALRALNIDLPARPQVLVELSLLLAEDEVDFKAMAALIEKDMALAASVLKTLNAPLYGLRHQVRTVQQALQYLGSSHVAAIVYEMGLRSVFPATPELDLLWSRASRRGLLMGLMARQLGLQAFVAHSAGLFEECGKAVMVRHAPQRYGPMLQAAPSDDLLLLQEMQAFGVSHDALGAALCETWMLDPAAIACVRYHVSVRSGGTWPSLPAARPLCALSTVAHYLMCAPAMLEAAVPAVAALAPLDEAALMQVAREVQSVMSTRL